MAEPCLASERCGADEPVLTGERPSARNPRLVICPTPIGNLGDIPPRALAALREADVVCAEDTRVTGKLLAALGVSGKRMERLDEAMIATKADKVLSWVEEGQVVAFCSDAGMPGVSDPGQRLIAAAYERDVAVEVLPGPTAVATAYVASGFTSTQFMFCGFFPRKAAEAKTLLTSYAPIPGVLLFYESPRRIVAALQVVAEVLPLRKVAVCRELTKLHEEVLRGTAAEVGETLQAREAAEGVKGEIVLVIDAPGDEEAQVAHDQAVCGAEERARELLAAGSMTKKDVVRSLRQEFGLSRNEAYGLVMSLG